jgi:hypothetical protein
MPTALGDGGGEVMRQTLTAEQATALEASLKDAPALWSGPGRA